MNHTFLKQGGTGGAYGTNKMDTCIQNCSRKDDLGVIVIDGRLILKRTLNRMQGCGLDSYGSGQGPLAGICGQCEEPSGSRTDSFIG